MLVNKQCADNSSFVRMTTLCALCPSTPNLKPTFSPSKSFASPPVHGPAAMTTTSASTSSSLPFVSTLMVCVGGEEADVDKELARPMSSDVLGLKRTWSARNLVSCPGWTWAFVFVLPRDREEWTSCGSQGRGGCFLVFRVASVVIDWTDQLSPRRPRPKADSWVHTKVSTTLYPHFSFPPYFPANSAWSS